MSVLQNKADEMRAALEGVKRFSEVPWFHNIERAYRFYAALGVDGLRDEYQPMSLVSSETLYAALQAPGGTERALAWSELVRRLYRADAGADEAATLLDEALAHHLLNPAEIGALAELVQNVTRQSDDITYLNSLLEQAVPPANTAHDHEPYADYRFDRMRDDGIR